MPMKNTPDPVSPAGALGMLILRVLQSGSIHGYAIAQKIHLLSKDVLSVEEGLLYPTLQKMLVKGWVKAEWGVSETNRRVRFYQLTAAGRKQLAAEVEGYERVNSAIQHILRAS
jgi:PadR family transcriptional regulator, regulatory protein PadR